MPACPARAERPTAACLLPSWGPSVNIFSFTVKKDLNETESIWCSAPCLGLLTSDTITNRTGNRTPPSGHPDPLHQPVRVSDCPPVKGGNKENVKISFFPLLKKLLIPTARSFMKKKIKLKKPQTKTQRDSNELIAQYLKRAFLNQGSILS